jgi:CDP-glucose 4,6-dehydratase
MIENYYKGRKVLVTGNTGFKGSWLTIWLLKMGAEVIGISKYIPTSPSLFEELDLEKKIKHYYADVRDLVRINKIITDEMPDYIFHLAAQAIVSTSYNDPVETVATNVIGTMNILEVLRTFSKPCVAIMITSDKCYDNVEWIWGYRETDALGGKDVYSGSKGAAELIIKSYYNSFFNNNHPVRLAVGRAGNVIGGGDWAKDRIVVDCMLAWNEDKTVEIRSPKATRPWQHVLEPLSGYLLLGAKTFDGNNLHGETFNFGPKAEQNRTVVELLSDMKKYWNMGGVREIFENVRQINKENEYPMQFAMQIIIGYLNETEEDFQKTVEFIKEYKDVMSEILTCSVFLLHGPLQTSWVAEGNALHNYENTVIFDTDYNTTKDRLDRTNRIEKVFKEIEIPYSVYNRGLLIEYLQPNPLI